ncbi:hypothetical protein D3C87_686440 [compost metagenome]
MDVESLLNPLSDALKKSYPVSTPSPHLGFIAHKGEARYLGYRLDTISDRLRAEPRIRAVLDPITAPETFWVVTCKPNAKKTWACAAVLHHSELDQYCHQLDSFSFK